MISVTFRFATVKSGQDTYLYFAESTSHTQLRIFTGTVTGHSHLVGRMLHLWTWNRNTETRFV